MRSAFWWFRAMIETLRRRSGEDESTGGGEARLRHRDGLYHSLSDHLHVSDSPSGEAIALSGSVREVTRITHLEENLRMLDQRSLF